MRTTYEISSFDKPQQKARSSKSANVFDSPGRSTKCPPNHHAYRKVYGGFSDLVQE